jgi:hypothetical protein
MKKIITSFALLSGFITAAQNIGIGTTSPNSAAKLEVTSTTSGVLVPRMTNTQRDIIATPPKGLLVFVTTDSSFYFYDGVWKRLLPANEAWNTKGNSGTDTSFNFIGTVDNTPLKFAVNNVRAGIIDPVTFNTGLGVNVLPVYTFQGIKNTAFGGYALSSVTYGANNTATGYRALTSNTSGNENTATGMNALYSNTTGYSNSAFGMNALYSNITGNNNTAIGYRSLLGNNGDHNTGVGSGTLGSNNSGAFNTAVGEGALYQNLASLNTAVGFAALGSNYTGHDNTAMGMYALNGNYSSGNYNSAFGKDALSYNISGISNTAIGFSALNHNTDADNNTASGVYSLFENLTGAKNTAVGYAALSDNLTGNSNCALGDSAGSNLTSGDYNIDIGNSGVAGESNTIRIGKTNQTKTFISGIYGTTTGLAGIAVYVDANGQLGTNPSSGRFKEEIADLNNGDDIYLLRPVSFRYKKEVFHGDQSLQYGLIAEEAEKVNPGLIAYDKNGEIFTVRYQFLTPLLIAALQKEHQRTNELEKKLAGQDAINDQLQKQINELKQLMHNQK